MTEKQKRGPSTVNLFNLYPHTISRTKDGELLSSFVCETEADKEEWDKVATQLYTATAREYFNRSYNLFPKAGEDRSLLFYCAFELRCAIERVFFEMFSFIKKENLSNAEAKLWSAKDLKAALLSAEPQFKKKIEFLALLWKGDGGENVYFIPDLERLTRDYGRLNNYLHALKPSKADDVAWWISLRRLIIEIHDYAWPYCAGPRVHADFSEVATEIFLDFERGEKSPEEIEAILENRPEGFEVRCNLHFYHE